MDSNCLPTPLPNNIAENGVNDGITVDRGSPDQEDEKISTESRSGSVQQMCMEQAHVNNALCALLIFVAVAATAVTFCITKSILCFNFLWLLSLLPSIKRRQEEALFPISTEDLQIRLKELDVEVERIKSGKTSTVSTLIAWLWKRLRGRL